MGWMGVWDGGAEIFLYLQANKFSLHSFVDSGRRHKTPESETKPLLFVAQQEAWQQHISISSPSSESQGGNVQPPGGCDVPESLIMVCKQTCLPFAWREIWSLSHWIASKLLSALEGDAVFFQSCLLATDFWKDCLEQSVSSWKMCRKARDPWRIVSHW